LAIASGIVSKALVLGAPGIKQSLNASLTDVDGDTERLLANGPLSNWTKEPVTPWTSFYQTATEASIQEVRV